MSAVTMTKSYWRENLTLSKVVYIFSLKVHAGEILLDLLKAFDTLNLP